MKKILIIILITLLVVLTYLVLFQGMTLGKLNILSVQQIADANVGLSEKIEDANRSITTDYPKAISELNQNTKKLSDSKYEYLDMTSVSSEEEIQQANQELYYSMEFLWDKIGSRATKEGVNVKLELVSGDTSTTTNLKFTITGSYIGITNYISALENDSELGFKIENFKLAPGGSNLQATFMVRNVYIKAENVQSSVQSGSNNTTSSTQNTTNTNTTNR